MIKRLAFIAVLLAALVAIGFTLAQNKQKLDAAQQKTQLSVAVPVVVAESKMEDLQENLTLIGVTQANQEVLLVSEAPGKVTQLNIELGSRVGTGALIATIDDELRKAALQNAEALYDKSKADLARTENLYKANTSTAAQLDAAKFAYRSADAGLISAKRQVQDTRVVSPISGVVVQKFVDRGATVGMNGHIALISDISTLKIRVNAAEKDAFRIQQGMKVRVETDVYPGTVFFATVKTVVPKGDEAHLYPVELELKNNDKQPLKAGMFVSTTFETISSATYLLVPRTAVVGSLKDAYVWVISGGKAKKRSVVAGRNVGTSVIILQGLGKGETVVTDGLNNLEDGVSVSVVRKESATSSETSL